MNNILEEARHLVHNRLQKLNKDSKISEESINKSIDKAFIYLSNDDGGQPFDKDELFEILKADLDIGKGKITMLDDNIDPWLSKAKSGITFELWDRYKKYLLENNPAFPANDLDDFTDKILDKCVNPKKEGSWDRRGMVVGYVQSGKTSNYVGLINKATDAGYKVIIVIAGTIGSLRKQTQERIDAGYVGRNSNKFIIRRENEPIGVGKDEADTQVFSFTSASYESKDEGDFNQQIANRINIPIGKIPIVFVIKKNKSILENLIDWFAKNENCKSIEGYPTLLDAPALIIDDEADAASVNTSKDTETPKTINRLIRTLLSLFNQKTFIGYTATPYANLFIPDDHDETITTTIKKKEYKIGEDLFPRDFIVNIKAPSNYVGAANLFGYKDPDSGEEKEPLDLVRSIDDYDPPFFKTINKNNKHILPTDLPKSLKKAMQSFILTCAIRRLRGDDKKHNSMLIHVALLVKWIDRIAKLVDEKMREYKNAIASEDAEMLQTLEGLYKEDFIPTTPNVKDNIDYTDPKIKEHTWEEVRTALKDSISEIEVRAVHGTHSKANLEYHNNDEIDYDRYKEGLSVIAVGGTKLSRGITLEGLSVSYYLRTTKMYDTLMQMSRWLGYRPGYVDLCRLYTTKEIFRWYNHITMATEELRNDFDEMAATHQRPKDFKLKVRNHHGLLTITSITKLRSSETMQLSFSERNIQTYQLLKTPAAITNNFTAFENLIRSIGFPDKENRIETKAKRIKYLYYPNQEIDPLCDFLEAFKTEQPNIKKARLTEYIRKQKKHGLIKKWNICVVSNTDEKVFIDEAGNTPLDKRTNNEDVMPHDLKVGNQEITLGCSVRNQPKATRDDDYYLIAKNQIDDLKDRQVDLLINNLKTNKAIKSQRAEEGKGLLLIYALDKRGTPKVDDGIPIMGYSIHFPKIEGEKTVEYTMRESNELDEEPMESDE